MRACLSGVSLVPRELGGVVSFWVFSKGVALTLLVAVAEAKRNPRFVAMGELSRGAAA